MLNTFAIKNYRSIQNLVAPLAPLNVVTGPSGSGTFKIENRHIADQANARYCIS